MCSRPTRERVKALASRPIESPTTATLSDAAPAGRRPRRRRGGGGRGPPPRSRCRALVASRGTERSSGGGARAAGGLVDQAGAAMTGGDRGIGVRGRSPGRYIHAPTFGGGVIGNTAGSGPVIGGSSPPPRATAPEAAKYPAPSSSGLGHHPLKVETRVRTPLGLPPSPDSDLGHLTEFKSTRRRDENYGTAHHHPRRTRGTSGRHGVRADP